MFFIETSGRFQPGRLVATQGVLEAVPLEELLTAYSRHLCQDWGLVCEEDWRSNDRAVKYGARIISAYRSSTDVRFWIITEADRSCTTLLLPSEY